MGALNVYPVDLTMTCSSVKVQPNLFRFMETPEMNSLVDISPHPFTHLPAVNGYRGQWRSDGGKQSPKNMGVQYQQL